MVSLALIARTTPEEFERVTAVASPSAFPPERAKVPCVIAVPPVWRLLPAMLRMPAPDLVNDPLVVVEAPEIVNSPAPVTAIFADEPEVIVKLRSVDPFDPPAYSKAPPEKTKLDAASVEFPSELTAPPFPIVEIRKVPADGGKCISLASKNPPRSAGQTVIRIGDSDDPELAIRLANRVDDDIVASNYA